MSIPLTASQEAFTPACLSEIEDAPTFTFRDATVLDKQKFHRQAIAEGLIQHSNAKLRETIVAELRRLFTSEGLEQNITKLEAYWQAQDEFALAWNEYRSLCSKILAEAAEGEDPELPPEPVLEFPEADIAPVQDMIDQVRRHSERVNGIMADNYAFSESYPRLLLRMFLIETSLPVKLERRLGLITPESAETAIEALEKIAVAAGVEYGLATNSLLLKATLAFALGKDEEKNSSSPRSGTTAPKASASKPSTSKGTPSGAKTASKSSDPVTSEPANGPSSPE